MATKPDRCECVIWRDGTRRCELWFASDSNLLRVYDDDRLIHEEPFEIGTGWERAIELRVKRPRTPAA
jgi:hypothetical protein